MAVDLQYSPGVRAGIPRPLVQRSFGTSFDAAPDGQHFLVELTPFDDARRILNGITDWTEELRHR
jgi:hypothetical protein